METPTCVQFPDNEQVRLLTKMMDFTDGHLGHLQFLFVSIGFTKFVKHIGKQGRKYFLVRVDLFFSFYNKSNNTRVW